MLTNTLMNDDNNTKNTVFMLRLGGRLPSKSCAKTPDRDYILNIRTVDGFLSFEKVWSS